MEKKILLLIVAIAVVCMMITDLQAQETDAMRTVSGVVTDSFGEPLRGVSIAVKTVKGITGVASDLYGKYTINVPENAILQFSFIGFTTQKIAIENKQIINITMADEFSKEFQLARPIKLTAKQSERAEADNNFAFRIFKEVSKQEGENLFFSPLSLNMTLGMLYNGASGKTRNEIVETLGIADFSETEINEYFQKISQALLEVDPTTNIAIANSIWYRNNFSVKNQFVEMGKEYFDAEVRALNFNSSSAADTINNWCAEKTNNRIQDLIGSTDPNDRMYLVNALYFKSQWQMNIKFDKKKTKLVKFTKTDNQKKKVKMMEQTSFMGYYADEHLQCVEMDYGNQAFSMVAVLPSKDMNINQLIDYLDGEKLQNVVKNMRGQKVWLKLPRFKIESSFSLGQPVEDLGMREMFNGGFVNISDDDLRVSDIIQKTFVEVNEEGTEAVAATAAIVVMGFGGRPKKIEPVRFFADRPFLYLIREKSTGVILFIGRMDEPTE